MEASLAVRQQHCDLAVEQSLFGLHLSRGAGEEAELCRPVVAMPGDQLHSASVDSTAEPVSIELDFMKAVFSARRRPYERGELRLVARGECRRWAPSRAHAPTSAQRAMKRQAQPRRRSVPSDWVELVGLQTGLA